MSWLYDVREVETWMIAIPFALMLIWAASDLRTGTSWKHRCQMAVLEKRHMREVIAGLRRDVEVLHTIKDDLMSVAEQAMCTTEKAKELSMRHQAGAAVAHAWRSARPERGQA